MTPYKRTYRIDKLYHQFLKPKGIPQDRLPDLIDRLTREGFIEVIQGRYIELDKMTSGKHKKELFNITRSFRNEFL